MDEGGIRYGVTIYARTLNDKFVTVRRERLNVFHVRAFFADKIG
jgi:glycyl-tRNA synthetase (class II)